MSLDRSRQCVVFSPAVAETGQNGLVFKAGAFAPFSDRQKFSVVGHKSAGPSVSSLFLSRGPAAVIRRVRAVVVLALQCSIGASIAHVCVEVLKRITPAVTDRDSAASIPVVVRKGFVVTSPLEISPRSVFHTLGHVVRGVVVGFSVRVSQATATLTGAYLDASVVDLSHISARALSVNVAISASFWRFASDRPVVSIHKGYFTIV